MINCGEDCGGCENCSLLEEDLNCSCGTYVGDNFHPCPFSSEIHNDDTSLCNCCDSCTRECAMDI